MGSRNEQGIPAPLEASRHYESFLTKLLASPISRRNFLTGLSSATASFPLFGAVARAASEFTAINESNAITLSIASIPVWRIDRSWFDGDPSLSLRKNSASLEVRLRHALFPGTGLPADMALVAKRHGNDWRAQLRIDALGFASDFSLPLWLLGHTRAQSSIQIDRMALMCRDWNLLEQIAGIGTFGPDWAIDIPDCGGTLRTDSSRVVPIRACHVELIADASNDLVTPAIRIWTTSRPDAEIALRLSDEELWMGPGSIGCFTEAKSDRASFAWSTSKVPIRLAALGDGDLSLPIRNASARMSITNGDQVTEASGDIDSDAWHTTVAMGFQVGTLKGEGSIALKASTDGTSSNIKPVVVKRFVVSIPGCDGAMFCLRMDSSIDSSPVVAYGANLTQLLRRSIDLDAYDLVVRRASDALYCMIRFRGFDLRLDGRSWCLVPRAAHAGDRMIEYDLGSQHLLEEAIYLSDWNCRPDSTRPSSCPSTDFPISDEQAAMAAILYQRKHPNGGLAGTPKIVPNADGSNKNVYEVLDYFKTQNVDIDAFVKSSTVRDFFASHLRDYLGRFEPAGASHLIFAVSGSDPLALNADELFKWAQAAGERRQRRSAKTRFTPVLSKRARPADALEIEKDKLDDLLISRPQSLANAALSTGLEYGTAIEVPARLVMTPIEAISGKTELQPPAWHRSNAVRQLLMRQDVKYELWNVRLEKAQVRAVFSPDAKLVKADDGRMVVDVFNPPDPYLPPSTKAEFRASIDKADRHEIVALSGLFGYRARCGTKQVYECAKDEGICKPGDKCKDSGRFRPTPIAADLLLSSQGATFRYQGKWDPPSSPPEALPQRAGALTIKQYDHRGQIGRDVYARVQYKGFLWPLSIPCVLNKVTERRYCMVQLDANRTQYPQFVAQLVQRFFIHVPDFTRSYPAEGQPLGGRLWGHAATSIAELTTPDLQDPTCCTVDKALGQRAFWPVGINGSDIVFEYFEEATGARERAPLVFVDNNVTHTKDKLKLVFDYWRANVRARLNKKPSEWQQDSLRFYAEVVSARLPYIIGERGGNTETETQRLLLGVHAPGEGDYGDNDVDLKPDFLTTPMEVHNQPPFYPVRRRALIASTQLATITGNSQDRYLIDYDPVFKDDGLANATNAGQLFAKFVEPGVKMNFGNDTSRSGGFASPSSLIVWLSKSRGFIGGDAKDLFKLGQAFAQPQPQPLMPFGPQAPAPVSAAHGGDLVPEEFLSGFLGDAKLLGVVRLSDVLRVVLKAVGNQIPTINREAIYDLALDAIRAILPTLTDLVKSLGDALTDPDRIPAPVATRLGPLAAALVKAVSEAETLVQSQSPDITAIAAKGKAIADSATRLSAEVKAIAQEPRNLLPQEVRDNLENAEKLLELVRKFSPPDAIADIIRNALKDVLTAAVEQQLNAVIDLAKKTPAYVAIADAAVRARDLIAQLRTAVTDSQKLLDALAADVIGRLQAVADELVVQAQLFEADITAGCMGLMYNLRDFILKIKNAIARPDEQNNLSAHVHAANRIAEVLRMGDTLIAGVERSVAASVLSGIKAADVANLLATARQNMAAICDALNGFVDRLEQVELAYDDFQNWDPTQLCSGNFTPATAMRAGQVRTMLTQALELPALAIRCTTRLADVVDALNRIEDNLVPAFSVQCVAGKPHFDPTIKQIVTKLQAFLVDEVLDTVQQGLHEFATGLDPNLSVSRALAAKLVAAETAVGKVKKTLLDLFDDQQGTQNLDCEFVERVRQKLAELAAQTKEITALLQFLAQTLERFDPESIAAKVYAELQAPLHTLRDALVATVNDKVNELSAEAHKAFCREVAPTLRNALGKLKGSDFGSYLSAEALRAIDDLHADVSVERCVAPADHWLSDLMRHLVAVRDLLSQSLSITGVGQLMNLDKLIDDALAALGMPTKVRVSYDWNTTVHAYPEGDSAIFAPVDDGQLTIKATLEASVKGATPTAAMDARLSPFFIHLFGKPKTASNFLSIQFTELILSLRPGKALECKTDVESVVPGDALDFISALGSIFGGRSGFRVIPGFHGLKVGYEYSKEYEVLGGFVLQNIAFAIYASLPFDNSPVRVSMNLASKPKPFLLSAGIYGGGGFFGLQTRADTLEILEASFEYGLVAAFAFGPVTGSGRVTAGVYIRMGGRNPCIEGFFCAAGECSVAGLITVSATLRVSLAYMPSNGNMEGYAEFEFRFSIGFLDYGYKTSVAYATKGDSDGAKKQAALDTKPIMLAMASGGDARDVPASLGLSPLAERAVTEPQFENIEAESILHPDCWNQYWRAFQEATVMTDCRMSAHCGTSTLRVTPDGRIV
jgi:hypothetical protein